VSEPKPLKTEEIMKRMTGGLVLAVLLMAPALAEAVSFRALYAFGDSLTDAGNAAIMSGDRFPQSPPYARRFSNGPVAAEYLAAFMGVPGGPSESGETNFAIGGATTGTENLIFETVGLPPAFEMTGMKVQITDAPAFNPSRTLFLVWGGPNDIFLALERTKDDPSEVPAAVGAAIAQAVANLAGEVGALANAGARYVLVPNMGDLGDTPFAAPGGPGFQDLLSKATQAFNDALASAMTELERSFHGRVQVTVFDTYAVQKQIMRRPRLFGFTNTTSPCLTPETLHELPACKGFLFFDSVHPTTAGHRILGALLAASCVHFGKSCFHGLGRELD
jgi:phospholipase/lecithinase/hemolysin